LINLSFVLRVFVTVYFFTTYSLKHLQRIVLILIFQSVLTSVFRSSSSFFFFVPGVLIKKYL
jgi:hypothetical protein